MSERLPLDSISDPTIAFMRRQRHARNWSAETLAGHCAAYGKSLEPPVNSTLVRTRIAKLESGKAKRLWPSEIALLAGVFGVTIESVLTNSDLLSEATPVGVTTQSGTVLERLATLEGAVRVDQAAYNRLAALETTVRLLGRTIGIPDSAIPMAALNVEWLPEPTWDAEVDIILEPAA